MPPLHSLRKNPSTGFRLLDWQIANLANVPRTSEVRGTFRRIPLYRAVECRATIRLVLIPESELMAQARRALREGRLDDAQGVLVNIVVVEPNNDEAWLMLAETMPDPQRKMECLERARRIDPRNEATKRALQALLAESSKPKVVEPPAPETTTAPESEAAPVQPAAPAIQAPDVSAAATENAARPHLASPILEYAETIVQAVMMSIDPSATRTLGSELVNQILQAREHDKILTRRWASSAGRDALVKYEKGLSTLITNLPQNDPQLSALRQERQRVLELFRSQ